VFEASGTVIPARQVVLLSEVEGRVIEQNKDLVPGGIVAEGDMLIQIDPLDYQLQAQGREAEVATAQYELDVEKGKQIIAQQEWKILRDELQEKQINEQLALRKPHLRHAEAQLNAAKSRLSVAKLAERRTTIRAPFNGLVLEEFVETGQFVGKQSSIATLVATDRFWVSGFPFRSLSLTGFISLECQKRRRVRFKLYWRKDTREVPQSVKEKSSNSWGISIPKVVWHEFWLRCKTLSTFRDRKIILASR